MDRKEIKKLWDKHELTTRYSYRVDFIKRICKDFGIEFDKSLIYTRDRYREQSDGKPRIDGEDLLIQICKKHNIEPNTKWIDTASKMYGEGSRRGCIEKAYLGTE